MAETKHVYTLIFELLTGGELLLGHESAETGYMVDDYPYGRKTRCRIRYWVETAAKGAAKFMMRPVSQTEEPTSKRWNAPRLGNYRDLVVLVKRADNGHVENFGLDRYAGPEYYLIFEATGAANALVLSGTDAVRQRYHACLSTSIQQNAATWMQYGRMLAVATHALDSAGADPDKAYASVRDWFDEVGDTRFGGKVAARPFGYRPRFDLFASAYAADCKMAALASVLRGVYQAGTPEEVPETCHTSAP